ncbi:uncharacterized protein haspin isoform X1 [Astyanax mexicanus]|uniref:uncharacterized protein haspin isoform X1 n=1 Tax=Astyanax mexicanus TaxID=7994 RepID=UPI0020CADEC8|nr:uncharacterized protein haspin isoform X1 [Astyanax mexicanus]
MSAFIRDRPVFLKTYGKQKRKLDQWFSPDVRKKAFSFSSTPSSDQSIPEIKYHKKRKKNAAAAGTKTTQRAMTALKELESDEENIPAASRNEISTKPAKKAAVTKKKTAALNSKASRNKQCAGRLKNKQQQISSSSEDEDNSLIINKKNPLNVLRPSLSDNIDDGKNEISTKPAKKPMVTKKTTAAHNSQGNENKRAGRLWKKRQQIPSSSEDEDDSLIINKKKPSSVLRTSLSDNMSDGNRTSRRVSTAAPLSRFVTRRKRAPPVQAEKLISKESFKVPSSTLNSSEDFVRVVPSLPRCVTRRRRPAVLENFSQESSDPKRSAASLCSSQAHSSAVLREVSLNDSREQSMTCKRPLLSSTPFLASRKNLRYLEPSIIELSSFSCDELEKPPAKNSYTTTNTTTNGQLMNKPHPFPTLQSDQLQSSNRSQESDMGKNVESAHQLPVTTINEVGDGIENGGEEEEVCGRGQMSASIEYISAQTHLDSRVEQLKDRCRSVSAVIMLEKVDISDVLSPHSVNERPEVEEIQEYSPCLNLRPLTSVTAEEIWHSNQSQSISGSALSDDFPKPLHITSSSLSALSIPPPSTSPTQELCSLTQALAERLKKECLSSCLTVSLQPLDRNVLLRFRQAPVKSPEAQAVAAPPPESKSGHLGNPEGLNAQAGLSSGGDRQKAAVVRRLSASYGVSAVSPAPAESPSKSRLLVVQKERAGAGTARKACVSGLSVSRWSKRGVGEGNKRQRKNGGRTRTKPGDCTLNNLLPGRMAPTGESVCDWLSGDSRIGLPGTPIRIDLLNLSALANFSPDMLTTHSWGRLKAALSIHKKKTAFPTPRRLSMSNMKSPGGMNTSLDLFGTPMALRTPLSKLASSRLLYSTMSNASIGPDEEISDAEKVYQECQQDGPLSFEDCIPPEQMKCCNKIGEGTFGEVFSTINSSNQTVALKIIPVEGSEKVNGEAQKTFGEILHEIIISKELSSLDSKENNKTNGFIGLNNLHCVQGCYPSALLKAWDKFDQDKTSENDRPDFFGKEQLFVILEFEFGGSDLENMNGKLSSMAQAKSLLHQVTAALAVAEQSLCFEHRDLHWGNILVKTTKEKHTDFILNGSVYSVETRGIHVNIIDYSLSRLEIDGLTVSCDISNDEELFMGQGDYQFEIYRLMKKENNNCWGEYNPHSNVLWLHYLVDKLLTMKYKCKAQSSQQRALRSSLKSFQSEILSFRSATDALLHCSLFQ